MRFHRTFRAWLCRWLMLTVVLTQLTTAAHACPVVRGDAMAGMPCAEAMGAGSGLDVEQPALCKLHCQSGADQQPAESPQPLGATAALLLPLFEVLPAVATAALPAPWSGHERRREQVPRTAHSVLHCCWRI